MKYFVLMYRSVFFYIFVAISYRIMGKREIGELSIMDFIVSIFISEIIAISIENYNKSMLISLIPVFILVLIQILVSYISLKNKKSRDIIDGEPSVIIDKGMVNFKEMKKQRYNIDDLLTGLRNNSIKSLDEVDYAILETSGKLSIFKKEDDPNRNYPLPLIVDGNLNINVLNKINKSKEWLIKELNKQDLSIEDIFYAFYKNNKLYLIESNKK